MSPMPGARSELEFDVGGRMHVLLLPSSYPTAASPVAALFCRDQAQALVRSGVRVGVVYPDRRSLRTLSPRAVLEQHGQTQTTVDGGATLMRWSGWNIPQREASGHLFRSMAVRLIGRYIERYGMPDLIHAHEAVWAGAAASQAAERFGLPYVLTEHSSGYVLGEIHGEAAAWAGLAYRKASRVIAVSRFLAASIAPFGAAPEAVEVIANVVDTDFFTLPDRPRRPSGRTRFLCLAQLQPAKGIDLLLRSFARAVAGRFDHYISRRDDDLRGRAGDEVPKLIAATLRELGVADDKISLIPDEQEAIDAALRMGQPGDLVLVFADALTRSWKQVIKFKSTNAEAPAVASFPPAPLANSPVPTLAAVEAEDFSSMEGLIRDERGIHLSREQDD